MSHVTKGHRPKATRTSKLSNIAHKTIFKQRFCYHLPPKLVCLWGTMP